MVSGRAEVEVDWRGEEGHSCLRKPGVGSCDCLQLNADLEPIEKRDQEDRAWGGGGFNSPGGSFRLCRFLQRHLIEKGRCGGKQRVDICLWRRRGGNVGGGALGRGGGRRDCDS